MVPDADKFGAESYDRHYSDRDLLKRILSYFRPIWLSMLFVTVTIVLQAIMDTAFPVLLAHGIDLMGKRASLRGIATAGSAILASGIIAWTLNYLRRRWTAETIGTAVLNLRIDGFRAMLSHDMEFFDLHASGKLVSRVAADTQEFADGVILILDLFGQSLLILFIGGVLVTINADLALLALSITPFILATALALRALARRSTQQARRALASVNATLHETLSGISVAKSFHREDAVYAAFSRINEQQYRAGLREGLVYSSFVPLLITVSGFGTCIVIYFGGLGVWDHAVSAGSWFLFVQSIGLFWTPLSRISAFWSQFQQGLAASERVFALIDAAPSVVQRDSQTVPRLAGHVELKDICFQYATGKPVLWNFNLAIEPGKTVAVVGHSGAGKSTLGKLISRLYEFQGGELLIDGRDIREFDLAAYRRQVSVLAQVPFLFSGTVAENIRFVRPEASDGEIAQKAEQIAGGMWLRSLRNGLQTEVGEGGRQLSLGQRQLVALARVLLQDPSILILDEATASIDLLTEAQIQEGLKVVLRSRTALIIAHRLSTIQYVDRIVVLEQGRVVEQGQHADLLNRGGYYADLYNTYFRHQSPDYIPDGSVGAC